MQKIDLKKLDKKSKIEIAVTFSMVVALIIILTNSMNTVLQTKKGFEPSSITPVALREIAKRDISISTRSAEIEKAYKEAEAQRAERDVPWGRDPFAARVSLKESSETIPGLRLEGIMWDKDEPCAIINGEVVRKGDKIGPNTIVGIEKSAVIVSDGAKEHRLSFW